MLMSETVLEIEGMTCSHCKMRVEKVLIEVPNVTGAQVNLNEKRAVDSGSANRADMVKAVHEAGYDVID